MSLFHFQHRDAKLEHGKLPADYPHDAILDIRFGPEDAFGVKCEPRIVAARGKSARIKWDANEGVVRIESELIARLTGTRESEHFKASLNGNSLQLTRRVNSLNEAVNFASSANQCLPAFLSFRFRTYVWIKEFWIQLGDARFRFALADTTINFPAATTEENVQRVWSRLDDWSKARPTHRRLGGALYYYRQALRLSQLQPDQISLVPEVVLNLTKALEIIFGTDRDIARKKARSLGLIDNEIEKVLIPVLLVRSSFDIAHVATGPLSPKERHIIVDFSSRATANVGRILDQVVQAGLAGNFDLELTSPILEKRKKELIEALDRYNREVDKKTGTTGVGKKNVAP